MGNKLITVLLLITALCWTAGCNGKESAETELTISVAASLQDAMNDLKAVYEQKTGVTLHLNVGSSGALKRQIEQGAPVDIFVSASEQHMEELVMQEKIDGASVVPLLTNTLVLITPLNMDIGVDKFNDLTSDKVKRIAVAFPESVPAGRYARETLEQLGLWELLYDKFVFAKDVRHVLSYVESENAEAGIVYKSDAELSSKVKLAAEARPSWHAPIVYPAGIVVSTGQIRGAEAFINFLQTDEAEVIFKQYGFTLLDQKVKASEALLPDPSPH